MKRKIKRQLSFTKTTHLILRLKNELPPMFEPRDHILRQKIFNLSKKYHVKIYDLVFNHSHLHAIVLLRDQKSYQRFIRELTAYIVHHFTKKLAIPGLVMRRIFLNRPFTRMVAWGKAYKILQNYMRKNEQESGEIQSHFNQLYVESKKSPEDSNYEFQI